MESNRIILAMNAKIKDEMKCKIAMQGIVEAAHAEVENSGTKSHRSGVECATRFRWQ